MGAEEKQEIRFIGDLQRLTIKPGDVFVLSTASQLSNDQCEHIRSELKKNLNQHKVLVLTAGMKLGVTGPLVEPVIPQPQPYRRNGIDAEIQQKIKQKTDTYVKVLERRSIINRGICPDCAGDLTRTSWAFNEMMLGRTKFTCNDCGARHVAQWGGD